MTLVPNRDAEPILKKRRWHHATVKIFNMKEECYVQDSNSYI